MNVTTNELIPISDNNGKKAVNARDLHSFLESKRDFSTWIKDSICSRSECAICEQRKVQPLSF